MISDVLNSDKFLQKIKINVNYYSENLYFPKYLGEITSKYKPILNKIDLENGTKIVYDRKFKSEKRKKPPIIQNATPQDAKEIVDIYHDIYHGNYPYKEMESEENVKKMILNKNYEFILFKDDLNHTVGCITFFIDKLKKGYIRGFLVKNKYQGLVDSKKAFLGAFLGILNKYKNVPIWFVENRTAHLKSQCIMNDYGLKPIAFLPNKDSFFEKPESILMQISYSSKVLKFYRRREVQIIYEVFDVFHNANTIYNLGRPKISCPIINIDTKKVNNLKRRIKLKFIKNKFGNIKIKLILKNTNSYFRFLFNEFVQNFEKVKYYIKNLEELVAFIEIYLKLAKDFKIRYLEAIVSAYKPHHQKIFLDAGLKPRGYIPCWKYSINTGIFEDYIIFNKFIGKINKDTCIINEGLNFLKYLI